ncbi:hypothetical protein R6Q59_010197 [Mikania micrantha]
MSQSNKAIIYAKTPEEFPVAGEHLVVKDIGFDGTNLPANAINVKVLYISVDPYMRGRMRDPSVKSYSPPFNLNEPLNGAGIGRVIASSSDNYKKGDVVTAFLPFQEYATVQLDRQPRPPQKVEEGLSDLGVWLGALGMPGLTAYSSLYEIGKPKKGETIFISSAAGAVGQLVGQLAKHEGLRVIGSVGSDEKLEFLTKELAFDGGFNYKKEKPLEALRRLAPDGVDIYYENVGGEQLEAALDVMNSRGRIVACGMISQYNKKVEDRYGVKNLIHVVAKRLTMRGFIVGDEDMGPKYAAEHRKNVYQWLKDGTFKAKVSVTEGIDNGANGFIGMLKGENFGKAVLKFKD